MTDDYLIYTFNLVYNPQTSSSVPVVRNPGSAAVIVECHYPRYTVSGESDSRQTSKIALDCEKKIH